MTSVLQLGFHWGQRFSYSFSLVCLPGSASRSRWFCSHIDYSKLCWILGVSTPNLSIISGKVDGRHRLWIPWVGMEMLVLQRVLSCLSWVLKSISMSIVGCTLLRLFLTYFSPLGRGAAQTLEVNGMFDAMWKEAQKNRIKWGCEFVLDCKPFRNKCSLETPRSW